MSCFDWPIRPRVVSAAMPRINLPRISRICGTFIAALTFLAVIQVSACKQQTAKRDEPPRAQERPVTEPPAVLWQDRRDISALNLFDGPGGKQHAPRENDTYKFIQEDLNNTSPKFYAEDSEGVKWLVKTGEEARPETVATRLVWSMGYFADEDYYVKSIKVSGLPILKRGQTEALPDGTVMGARLKREENGKKVANWDWTDNPFVGTRELNGLRVIMALINNWDLTTANNKILNPTSTERRYVVSDLGASLGRTGEYSTRSKGIAKDFSESEFIEQTDGEFVDFRMATRPSLWKLRNPAYYKMRIDIGKVAKHVPRADAKWMGQQLSRLTPGQMRDAFRAAGYTPADIEAYAQAIQARITALLAL